MTHMSLPAIWHLMLLTLVATAFAAPSTELASLTKRDCVASSNNATKALTCSKKPIVNGVVSFGDSFAAGLGAGKPSGVCQQGTRSYSNLLVSALTSKKDGMLQNLACTDASISSIDGQVSKWKDAGKTDFATLTVGADDVNLFSIVNSCILQAHASSKPDADCEAVIKNSFAGKGDVKIVNALTGAIDKIYAKGSGRKPNGDITNQNFKLYITGYARPFRWSAEKNSTTGAKVKNVSKPKPVNKHIHKKIHRKIHKAGKNPCEDLSFSIYNPMYKHSQKNAANQYPLVSRKAQKNVNLAFHTLNKMIRQAVMEWEAKPGNKGKGKVVYISIDKKFKSHTMCRRNKEFDPADPNMYFFLSGFKEARNTTNNGADIISTPPSNLRIPCDPSPKKATGWSNAFMCAITQGQKDKNSIAYKTLAADQKLVKDKKPIKDVKVPYWMPFVETKAFHWKTQGNALVAKAILADWEKK